MPYIEDQILAKTSSHVTETVIVNVKQASHPKGGNVTDSVHFNGWPNEAGFTASKEQLEPIKLPVRGEFPSYTAGTLLRTGPGTYKVSKNSGGEYARSHWFDGFTYTYKFEISPGPSGQNEVQYMSRCTVDKLLEKARSSETLEGITFGQKRDPCDSLFKKLKTAYQSSDVKADDPRIETMGVVLMKTPGKPDSKSLTEASDKQGLKEFDLETLEPIGVTDQKVLHPELTGPLAAAHAAVDPVTGDIFNYNLDFGRIPTYRIFKTDMKTRKTEILAKISEKDIPGAYIHSLFLTENYVVLCVWPAQFKKAGISILWEQNLLDALQFQPSAQTSWIVIDRRNGRGVVNRFTSDSMFAFHFVNGWEQINSDGSTDIICDLVNYKNMDILHKFYYENLVSTGSGAEKFTLAAHPESGPRLTRFCLASIATDAQHRTTSPLRKPQKTKILKTVPSPRSGELPKINESLLAKRHRYVYSIAPKDLSSFVDCIVKTDMDEDDAERDSLEWIQAKHTPGEPIFIPDPAGTKEDDGVVLSVVLDGEKGTSYLLCLDARSMTEIARAEVDTAVGLGFHGIHLPSS